MKKMLKIILDLFAPNDCYFCGKIGENVCENCFEKIDFELKIVSKNSKNSPKFEFYLSEREDVLRKIVDEFKFQNKRENSEILAKFLAKSLQNSPVSKNLKKAIFVPVPTSKKHIRERGFDHVEEILRDFSEEFGARFEKVVARKGNFAQRGASAKTRKIQASKSYEISKKLDKNVIYVIFDDIRTTGATIDSICEILRKNGAREIWAVYLMRQKI